MRREEIVKLMKGYGAAAQPYLPALKEHLAFLQQEHVIADKSRQPPPVYHKAQIPMLEEMIKAIEGGRVSD